MKVQRGRISVGSQFKGQTFEVQQTSRGLRLIPTKVINVVTADSSGRISVSKIWPDGQDVSIEINDEKIFIEALDGSLRDEPPETKPKKTAPATKPEPKPVVNPEVKIQEPDEFLEILPKLKPISGLAMLKTSEPTRAINHQPKPKPPADPWARHLIAYEDPWKKDPWVPEKARLWLQDHCQAGRAGPYPRAYVSRRDNKILVECICEKRWEGAADDPVDTTAGKH